MRVLWSRNSKRVHKYDDNRIDERCNSDQILDEDRKVDDVPTPVAEWAAGARLKLCHRCFSEAERLTLSGVA